jgi:hypothetical protein
VGCMGCRAAPSAICCCSHVSRLTATSFHTPPTAEDRAISAVLPSV